MSVKKIVASTCNECKREYPIDNFYEARGKFMPNKVVLYCKDCCNDMFKEYLKKTGSVESAMWYLCAKLDIPFIKKVFQRTESQVKTYQKVSEKDDEEYNWVLHYMNFLWGSQSLMKKTDIWEDFTDTDVELNGIKKLKKSQEVLEADCQKFELDWGKQTVEDYQYLEYRWDFWTSDKPINKAQEVLYRQLCLLELRKRKKESKNDLASSDGDELGDSTKEEQDLIIKLMDKLKISNFAEQKDKSDFDLLMERQIWEQENKKPCEIVDLDYYKDLCDIKKNWGKHILRAIRNLVAGTKDYPDIEKDL